MEAEREVFLHGNKEAFESGKDEKYAPGCVANGISESVAEEIWNRMANFASYAFNRSHAACYAWIANITAYMACHWPEYFYAAMMNAFVADSDKLKSYLGQALARGIKLLPPDINRSGKNFTVDREAGGIRFGLCGLSGFNKLAEKVVFEREESGKFTDIEDFYSRMADKGEKPSSSHLKALALSGGFDSFGINRRTALSLANKIADGYKADAKNRIDGQITLFETGQIKKFEIPTLEDFSPKERFENEFSVLGVYLSGHPADVLYSATKPYFPTLETLSEIVKKSNGAKVLSVGVVKTLKRRYTKKGEPMLNIELQDRFNAVKCVVFPSRVEEVEQFLVEGKVVAVRGRFNKDENFGDQITVEAVYTEDGLRAMRPPELLVFINGKEEQEAIRSLSAKYPGKSHITLRTGNRDFPTKWRIDLANLSVVDKLSNMCYELR